MIGSQVVAEVSFASVAGAYPPVYPHMVGYNFAASLGLHPCCASPGGVLNAPALIGESSAFEAGSLSHWGVGMFSDTPPFFSVSVGNVSPTMRPSQSACLSSPS